MRTTFKNYKKTPRTNTRNSLPKHYYTATLLSIRNKSSTSHRRNLNPPDLRAQIKLHKPGKPIRPVVNNMNAPANKISKLLVNRLNNLLNLRSHCIVNDSTALASDLTKMKLDENHRMITLDIKDLYVNIPIQETLRIAKTLL